MKVRTIVVNNIAKIRNRRLNKSSSSKINACTKKVSAIVKNQEAACTSTDDFIVKNQVDPCTSTDVLLFKIK